VTGSSAPVRDTAKVKDLPGGARTEFRYGSAQVADLLPAYDGNPAQAFLAMLDPANGPAVGDPARMAARIIESIDTDPAPLRLVLGSQALDSTIATLQKRVAGFEAQRELAASTDFPLSPFSATPGA
jgi:hypothetical protein